MVASLPCLRQVQAGQGKLPLLAASPAASILNSLTNKIKHPAGQ